MTRERVLVLVLALLTAAVFAAGLHLAWPFVPAITWALVLAVIAQPLHTALLERVRQPWLAAALSVVVVALGVAAPAAFVAAQVADEAFAHARAIRELLEPARRDELLDNLPVLLAPFREWLESRDLGAEVATALEQSVKGVVGFFQRSFEFAVGTLVTLFLLFFFLRDRDRMLGAVRALVPLAPAETGHVVANVAATIHAIVYGTLLVAAVQGVLGGLAFWTLDLPAPLLWGVVMAILAVVPVLGAAAVWLPATLYLAATGDWPKAMALAAWGAVVISLVDNLLYPILVRSQLRLHTVPVFIAVLGGLVAFGATGIVLGPLILAIGLALIDIWRRRMARGEVESAVGQPQPQRQPLRAARKGARVT